MSCQKYELFLRCRGDVLAPLDCQKKTACSGSTGDLDGKRNATEKKQSQELCRSTWSKSRLPSVSPGEF